MATLVLHGLLADTSSLRRTNGDRRAGMVSNANNDLQFKTANQSTKMTILGANGRVGIGTTNPQRDLEISRPAPRIRLTDTDRTGDAAQDYIEFYGNDSRGAVIHTHSKNLNFQNDKAGGHQRWMTEGGNEKMRLTNTGRLGILNQTPSSLLHIGDHTGGSKRDDAYITFGKRSDDTTETNLPFIGQPGYSNGKADLGLGARSSNGAIRFYTGSASSVFSSVNERVTLIASGNLGVGTTTPAEKVDVIGTVRSIGVEYPQFKLERNSGSKTHKKWTTFLSDNGSYVVKDETTPLDILTIEPNPGKVGINAGSPNAQLDVKNTHQPGNAYVLDVIASAVGQSPIFRVIGRNIANTSTSSFDIIKVTASGTKLRNTDTHADNFTSFDIGSQNNVIYMGANGRVGIKKTNPAVALHITGQARSTTSTTNAHHGTTLVTKDYITSTAGNDVGQFGYWTRSGTTLSMVNNTDAVTLGGTLDIANNFNINSGKFSVNSVNGNTIVGGVLDIVGNVKVNTDKFVITSGSGNTATKGTLTVDGATTLKSTAEVTGNFTVNTNKFKVLAASGNTTVAGTLTVTGATTLNNTLAVKNTSTIRHLRAEAHNTYDIGVTGTRFRDIFLSRNGRFGARVFVESNAADALQVTGKATSASTVAADPGTTLVTKDYITSTSGGGNTGQFGFWTRSGTTLSMVNNSDTLSLGGVVNIAGNLNVNTNKFKVLASNGNTTIAGTLGVAGNFAVNTDKFKVIAGSGNTTTKGTLVVDGATTLKSTLAVTGNVKCQYEQVPNHCRKWKHFDCWNPHRSRHHDSERSTKGQSNYHSPSHLRRSTQHL